MSPLMGTHAQRRWIAVLVPYAAVLIGFFLMRSAWAAILLYHLGIVVTLVLAKPAGILQNARRGLPGGPALLAIVVCAGVGPAFVVLWGVVGHGQGDLRSVLAECGLAGVSWWAFMAYYALVHPVLEEIYWRGYLGSGSRRPASRDFLFAAYHALVLPFFIRPEWVVVSCAVLLVTAWGWRHLAHRYGGLGIPVLSHTIADLSLVVAVEFLARSGR